MDLVPLKNLIIFGTLGLNYKLAIFFEFLNAVFLVARLPLKRRLCLVCNLTPTGVNFFAETIFLARPFEVRVYTINQSWKFV